VANVYLHEVLDVWFERGRETAAEGRGFLVRYAERRRLLFSREEDARRVMEVLPKRFGKYGLTLHPDKTRLIESKGRTAGRPRGQLRPARDIRSAGLTITGAYPASKWV